ncbi:uncharacterized protein [Fopius arisanus]|uniref:VWFC domain-containing protein n=1 Tax=Fopius arisanus TaxID=64838 RepID=A0A9R1TUQ3_9HYME|nr:PREDICTED: uncharacterized protein LOC105263011 [Fopius arisanus]
MVRDIEWKTMCDNCFCAMGGIRCVPLACAPPLRGCTPIVREGQCCPSTYNCSGSIAVKSSQSYASYAFISKDYAKFRKETNFLSPGESGYSTVEGRSHRQDDDLPKIEEPLENESTISGIEVASSTVTYETETMDNEIPTESMDYPKSTTSAESITQSWTSTDGDEAIEASSTIEISTTSSSNTTIIDYQLTTNIGTSTVIDYTLLNEGVADTTVRSDGMSSLGHSIPIVNEKNGTFQLKTKAREKMDNFERNSTSEYPEIIFETTFGTIKEKVEANDESMGGVKGAVMMPEDILVMNVTLKTNVSVEIVQSIGNNSVRPLSTVIQRIVNITDRKKEQDYEEYDYNEPTLPPSLPNVRIIPFVAADALVKDKESTSPVTAYPLGLVGVPPELRPTDVSAVGSPSNFYNIVTQANRFSPPVETEGLC